MVNKDYQNLNVRHLCDKTTFLFSNTKPALSIVRKINYKCDKLMDIFNIYIYGFACVSYLRNRSLVFRVATCTEVNKINNKVKVDESSELIYSAATAHAASSTLCVTHRTVIWHRPQPKPALADCGLQPYSHNCDMKCGKRVGKRGVSAKYS